MTKAEIANILKEARKSAGLTQKQAAETIGRKQQTLASWETAQSQPDANTLFELCNLYGVSVDETFGFNNKSMQDNKTLNISEKEQNFIKKYRSLNENGKNKVDEYLKFIKSQPENVKYKPNYKDIEKHAEEISDELNETVNSKRI